MHTSPLGDPFKILGVLDDQCLMRRFRSFIYLTCLLTLASPGCTVIEEIDAAQAKMPANAKKKSESQETETDRVSALAAKKDAFVLKSEQWWDRATSLAPAGLDSGIAQCRLRGSTQYMSKDDCRARGGTVESRRD